MNQNNLGRPLYSLSEILLITCKALRALPFLKPDAKETFPVTFRERVMLAVTKVNGCAMCSYAHTQMALESGLTNDEIKELLQGEFEQAPDEEIPALLFAQHYAFSRAKPSEESVKALYRQYGQDKANAILSAIRVMMMGNAYGIPFGSLHARFKKNSIYKDARSHLGYELGVILILFPCLIIGTGYTLCENLLRKPLI